MIRKALLAVAVSTIALVVVDAGSVPVRAQGEGMVISANTMASQIGADVLRTAATRSTRRWRPR